MARAPTQTSQRDVSDSSRLFTATGASCGGGAACIAGLRLRLRLRYRLRRGDRLGKVDDCR